MRYTKNKLSYVLITPAHNEEKSIEKTIQSVLTQETMPAKWVIVNDGSSDRTEQIVRGYAKGKEWIILISMPEHMERQFAAKVHAFNVGYESLRDIQYNIVGCLDADISFGKDYFAYLLEKFEKNPRLGVAGTDYIEGSFHSSRDSYINHRHVNGGCQLFRRECFEEIGGYIPIEEGGIDWVAVTTARMKGWETRSFQDRTFTHHCAIGRTYGNRLSAWFNYGKKDYFLGGHPGWEILRGFYQMTKKPYVVGGMLLISGYFWRWATRMQKPVSKELVEFYRQEQMQRLWQMIRNKGRACG